MVTINDSKILDLPKFLDKRGNLSFVEELNHIPFKIMRSYWIYDVPGGESRGGHAYKENQEFIIALSGSLDVILGDGIERKVYSLNRSYKGLYVPNGLWRQMANFSTNSLALVLSSTRYDEKDYIRDFNEFLNQDLNNKIKTKSESQFALLEDLQRLVPFNTTSVFDCTMIELNKHHSSRKGNITVVENFKTVPFDVKRIYYLYDIPGGEERGAHAHKRLYQLIFSVSGSFDVVLDDGNVKRTFNLNRSYQGLLVVPGIWRELINFSSGSVCLVLASERYDKDDYIRDYDEFRIHKYDRTSQV
ncbi:MAG: FdtA/QdtA family cupin domain-containing protein [Syntrophomonas sp.]